ncbi:MBL fold metallo-hydrolase [bacterium]|nr:MBL fold metallo-hydrolase [bacterium]
MATLTILVDNVSLYPELQPEWGFSCLLEGFSKTILFDTGASGRILMSNMKKLSKDPENVDIIVISHDHWDHTGGLKDFLTLNSRVQVWVPGSTTQETRELIINAGAELIIVDKSQIICDNIFTTGNLGIDIVEQSLVLKSGAGIFLVTGCSHPGIVNITRNVKQEFVMPVFMVLGGFHLLNHTAVQLQGIFGDLKELGVVKVAPCHCTGKEAISAFEEKWQGNFIKIGCGACLTIDLPGPGSEH